MASTPILSIKAGEEERERPLYIASRTKVESKSNYTQYTHNRVSHRSHPPPKEKLYNLLMLYVVSAPYNGMTILTVLTSSQEREKFIVPPSRLTRSVGRNRKM